MRITNRCRFVTIAAVSMSISHIPQIVTAEVVHSKMISTTEVLQNFDRQQTQEKISNYLSQKDIEQKLVAQGVSAAEAKDRVASLSDQELQNLSQQIDKAQYGGDILVTILLVVLIIYLVKRI